MSFAEEQNVKFLIFYFAVKSHYPCSQNILNGCHYFYI